MSGGAGRFARRARLSDAAERAAYFVKAAAAIYVVREHLVELTVCVGPSMQPTFNARGDVALLEHVTTARWAARARAAGLLPRGAPGGGGLRVGDVVVAASPQNPRHAVCKRVLALEGQPIPAGGGGGAWRDGGGEWGEQWRRGGGAPRVVPRGHVWLQGDNAANSTDSRHYGPVPAALLRGRVFAKVWPPREAGWVGRAPGPTGAAGAARRAREHEWRR